MVDFFKMVLRFSKATWTFSLISIISLPILTRIYSPHNIGQINYFILVSNLLSMFMIFGMDHIILRYSNNKEYDNINSKDLLGYLLNIGHVIFIATIIMSIIFNDLILDYINIPNNILLYIIIINGYCMVIQRLFNLNSRVLNNSESFARQLVLPAFFLKLLLIVFGLLDGNWKISIYAYTTINFFMTLIIIVTLRKQVDFRAIKNNNSKRMFKFAIPLMFLSPLAWLNTNYPIFIINNSLGSFEVGIFTTALSVIAILNVVQSGFNMVWAPFVFKNYKNISLVQKISELVVLILILLYHVSVLLKDIIVLFVGAEYRIISSLLPYLLIIPIYQTLIDVFSIGLLVKEKSKVNLSISIIMMISLLLSLFLIREHISLINISLILAFNYILMFFMKAILAQKLYKTIKCLKSYVIVLLCIPLVIWGINFFFKNYLSIYVSIAIILNIGIIVFKIRKLKSLEV